jgi:hypothetical protein
MSADGNEVGLWFSYSRRTRSCSDAPFFFQMQPMIRIVPVLFVLVAQGCSNSGMAAPRSDDANAMGPAHIEQRSEDLGSASATSRDALVRKLVRSLNTYDAHTIGRLRLSAAEYAYVYFPSSRWVRKPYNASSEPERRLINELGGRALELTSYSCDEIPLVEGDGRLWNGCRLVLKMFGRRTATLRMEGAIVERGGKFKFVDLANSGALSPTRVSW